MGAGSVQEVCNLCGSVPGPSLLGTGSVGGQAHLSYGMCNRTGNLSCAHLEHSQVLKVGLYIFLAQNFMVSSMKYFASV